MREAVNRLLGQRLRELRHTNPRLPKPATQAEFAALTGINKSTIVNIENQRQGMTLSTLYLLAAALDIEPAQLLPDLEEVLAAIEEPSESDRIEEVLPEWADWLEKKAHQWQTEGGSEP